MKKPTYTVILDWMLDKGLSASELLCYATVYGFCQDGESRYSGSRNYLARKMAVSSNRTVDAALQSLCEKGLLEKSESTYNGVKFCYYSVVWSAVPGNMEQTEDVPSAPKAAAPKFNVSDLARELCPGFVSPEWFKAIETLQVEPKWKKKTENAWKMTFDKLSKHPEPVAIEMIRRTIAGGWQGVFDLDQREVNAIMGNPAGQAQSFGPSRPNNAPVRRGGIAGSEEIVQNAMAVFNRETL